MNNIKILIHLLDKREEKFTINQLSKILNINYRIAHTQIKFLEKENLVKTEKVGKSLHCSLTKNFNEKIFIAEYQRLQNFLKINKDFKLIIKRFEKAKQNYILLLFGSYAKGIQTKHSDIDLLAITENGKEIDEIVRLIPKNIHLINVNYEEFLNMKKSNEITVGTEVMKNNIILIGIEDYYRLLEND